MMRRALLRGLAASNPTVVSRVGTPSFLIPSSSSSSFLNNNTQQQQLLVGGWRLSSTIPRVVPEEERKGIKIDAEKV